MVSKVGYEILDRTLKECFEAHKEYICCKPGCSLCCEKGDYPLTLSELGNVMEGFSALEDSKKIRVQNNIKNMVKGGACPFLLDNYCSIYPYRPIICRVHGLAYYTNKGVVKLPYCVNLGKNYSSVYKDGVLTLNPAKFDFDDLLRGSEVKNMYDWFHPTQK